MARTYSDVAEPRYVERAKVADEAGTEVIANPTLVGTEAALQGIQVGDTKYKVGAGAASYVGNDIIWDSVGQYAYIPASVIPTIKAGDLYFINTTYTSNGHTFNKGEIYELSEGLVNEFDATLINTLGVQYEQIFAQKGDIISMNLDNTTAQNYRVIKMLSGSIAEVVAMTNVVDSQDFGSTQVYEGSNIDGLLENTYFLSLTSAAQEAIVPKTFTQDSWYSSNEGDPDYSGYYGSTNPGASAYTISLGSATFGAEITRHVYALSVQDVLDYVLDTNITDGQLQNYNIWKMFWNDEVQHAGNENSLRLRSASVYAPSYAFRISGLYGQISDYNITANYAVRPAFQIDLSKISFTKV